MSINNKRSYTEYTVTQPTTDFAIGFDDFDEGGKDIILVTLNGVLVESLGYAAMRKNESTVSITPAITEGTVRLTRETDIDEPFHKFTAGALFSAKSMDENFQQVRHSQQEVRDGFVFLEHNTNGIVQASKEATIQAKAATVEATASAVRAETAADTAVQAVGSLQGVVNAATTATTKANTATATANIAASQTTAATTSAQNAAQAANTAKQEAVTATANAQAATVDSLAATGRANEAADVIADLVVGKVRAQDVSTADGSTQAVKNTDFRSELNALTGFSSTHQLINIGALKNGSRVYVQSYWESGGKGGNWFVYDASMSRNKHNGGSIIDPTKEWDGSRAGWAFIDGYLPDAGVGGWGVDDESILTAEVKSAILSRGGDVTLGSHLNPTNFRTNQFILGGFLGKSTSTGNGCWVAQTSELNFTMFGAVGDASYEVDGTDDSFAMIAAIRALPRKKAVLNIEPYYYTHGNGDIRNIVLYFNGIKDLTIKGNTACIQSHSNNLPVASQVILRFDYVENARIYALNTDGRLDTRMVVGSDPNTNNDQHNVHVGSGCKDILFVACRADRAMMDGFYIYGDQHDRVATRTSDITFFECHANECYRQGSSLITALGVKWLGGSYTNTGTCKDKVTGAQKGTSPMRGIDIEANEATYLTRAEYIIDGCLLSGNRNAGASPSNNAYGTIQNCVVRDNKYMGILVEHNAKNSKVINNKFSNNAEFDLWLDCTHLIKVMLNNFKTRSVPINAPNMDAYDTTLAKVDIEHNIFEPADGEEKGGSCSFDFSDVNFSHNTLRNMSPTFVGGYSKFSYNHNTFTSTNAETTFAVQTWSSSSFKSIVGNSTTLVTGSLLGEGYVQANIDYLANNSTSTEPNSGLYEIHKGKLIWNQLNNVPFLEGTPTTDEVAIKVNNLIGEMINRGIMK